MPSLPNDDTDVYIVIEDFGDLGRSFRETDLAEADLGTIVHNMISGEYRNPLRVIAFNTVEGWSRDVSEEIAYDVLDRAYDPDATLSVGAKRFIDRHVTRARSDPRRRRYCANRISRRARRREDGSTSPVGIMILARWASEHEGSTSRPAQPSSGPIASRAPRRRLWSSVGTIK
jgi:hypothetical protein